ncbi:hypothetical protein KR093_005617 [Drosophila rubida]|uniref:G-protein coupled receptors family 1 profile domain-containing protein n=1 Tax=Drosophila rubida TaxID=30044 RepID=A0AAD4K113_9MUSC|nr:hypothetical protein KR093_005617 [Drosophila rubida]
MWLLSLGLQLASSNPSEFDFGLNNNTTVVYYPNETLYSTQSGDYLSGTGSSMHSTDLPTYQHCIATRNSFADLLTLVLYGLVCIVGLFGNTLVIYVVLRFSKMQTVTNIYILNLAIADECFLIGIPFLLYTMRICSWRFGELMCKAYMVSTSITSFTSSIFLLIMSADRYIAVCHPISSPRYRTLHIAKLVSALAWTTSAVLMLPVMLYASTVEQEDGVNYSCNIMWPDAYKKHSGTTFILYTFFLGFATPLCFILSFYYLVIRKLRSVGPKHTTKSKEKRRAHRKVTRLVLTVITVYICCWLPHWMSQLALINSNPAQRDLSRLEILIFLLLGALVYSNSAVNPILYAFLSENFRKSFFKAFTCMNKQEINAQLQHEPSVFTKQGSRRRGGSKRLLAANAPHSQQQQQPPLLALHVGNNNSSTTTSSTTTAEKTGSTNAPKSCSSNGKPGAAPPPGAENLIICLDEQRDTYCTTSRRSSTLMQQTDL